MTIVKQEVLDSFRKEIEDAEEIEDRKIYYEGPVNMAAYRPILERLEHLENAIKIAKTHISAAYLETPWD